MHPVVSYVASLAALTLGVRLGLVQLLNAAELAVKYLLARLWMVS